MPPGTTPIEAFVSWALFLSPVIVILLLAAGRLVMGRPKCPRCGERMYFFRETWKWDCPREWPPSVPPRN